jgi:hypothetical protein
MTSVTDNITNPVLRLVNSQVRLPQCGRIDALNGNIHNFASDGKISSFIHSKSCCQQINERTPHLTVPG